MTGFFPGPYTLNRRFIMERIGKYFVLASWGLMMAYWTSERGGITLMGRRVKREVICLPKKSDGIEK